MFSAIFFRYFRHKINCRLVNIFLMGLLSFIFGCSGSSSYQKKGDDWFYKDIPLNTKPVGKLTEVNKLFAKDSKHAYYRETNIAESDSKTFVALSDHYAKDKNHVYHCDTYRKGQEYFMIKHNNITIMEADPSSFVYLASEYAKDSRNVFFEGTAFAVKDVAGFELLDYGFAKDHISAYYLRTAIKNSDAKSFAVLDNKYSKDETHIYYSYVEIGKNGSGPQQVTNIVTDADPATFRVAESGYAWDKGHVFYNGAAIDEDPSGFTMLQLGYAKTSKKVYYDGKLIRGADAGSFSMLEKITDTSDARDSKFFYKMGEKVK